jgi:hypothetical protein
MQVVMEEAGQGLMSVCAGHEHSERFHNPVAIGKT